MDKDIADARAELALRCYMAAHREGDYRAQIRLRRELDARLSERQVLLAWTDQVPS